jgi:hypothetical protein
LKQGVGRGRGAGQPQRAEVQPNLENNPRVHRTDAARPREVQNNENEEDEDMRKIVEVVCAIVDRKEMHRSQQPHHSRLHDEPHQHSYYGNDVKRELPKFDENPKDYKIFRNHYDDSEKYYTAAQNLSRITKALPERSPARTAVLELLSLPENISTILKERLKFPTGTSNTNTIRKILLI